MTLGPEDNGVYEFGPFRVDVADRLLSRDGTPVQLEPTQFELLSVLVREAGHLVHRKHLIQAVWKETHVDEQSLTVMISLLRRKLGDLPSQPRYIETVRKAGYRFVAPVTRRSRDTSREQLVTPSGSQPYTPVSRRHSISARHGWNLAALAAVVAIIAGGYWFASRISPEPTPAPVPLYPFGGMQDEPSFSSDGTQVAFTWRPPQSDNEDIFVLRIGELEASRLTSHPARDHAPSWSPDGRQIAFVRSHESRREILLISPAGGPERKVVDTHGTSVTWSADSQTLAFGDRADGEEVHSVFLVSGTGGVKRQLTFPAAEQTYGDSLPAISPDGRTLAFVRHLTYDVSDLFVQPLDSVTARRLTFDKRQIRGLAWTSNSKELTFSSNRDGRHRLWRIHATGTAEPTAVGGVTEARSVAVSDSRVVYQSFTEDYNIRVATREPDGTWNASHASTFAASIRNEQSPRLSPDGRRLSFVSDRSGWFELWVCTYPEGANCKQLTAFRQGYVGSPRWAPDGERIVFDARVDGNADIYLVRADGGQPVRLTNGTSVESGSSWSRDGRWIYFRSDRTGGHQIWKMPLAGGAAIQVTKHGGFDARESPDGKSLYYVQERYRRGLWTVAVDGGPETRLHGLGSLTASSWTVTNHGILWIDVTTSNPAAPVRSYDSATGEVRTIAAVSSYVLPSATGFDAVADGSIMMWSQLDRSAHDLMLLDGLQSSRR